MSGKEAKVLTARPELLEAALFLASRRMAVRPGYHVGPDGTCTCRDGRSCSSPGKHPRSQKGADGKWSPVRATHEPDRLRSYWQEWPFATLRIATGPGHRLMVVDIDRHNEDADGFVSLRRLEVENVHDLPDTVTALTAGGGEHRYFVAPAEFTLAKDTKALLAPGLEVLYGQDAVAPPSQLGPDNQGGVRDYRWKEAHAPGEIALAAAPDWLLELVAEANGGRANKAAQNTQGDTPGPDVEHPPWATEAITKRFGPPKFEKLGWVVPCPIKERHANGDEHPSLWLHMNPGRWAEVILAYCRSQECHEKPPKGIGEAEIFRRVGMAEEERRQPKVGSHPERFRSIALGARQFLEREYPKPRNLLGDGIFCAGDFGILYGVPGGGKTFAALQLARALVRGEPWFGIKTGDGNPLRVGILELEVHGFRLQARLRAIAGDAGLDERDDALELVSRPDLKGRVNMLDPADVAALATWCRESRLDLLIVDALNRVHDVDENQAVQMSPVLAAFDQLRFDTGTAILLLHHEPKTSANGREVPDLDALRGSSRLRDDPNVLIRLVKKSGSLRCLRFPKVNNADEPAPIWLLKSKTGPLEVTEAPEAKADKNREKVHKALLEGVPHGRTSREIQSLTGLGSTAVSKHLNALGAIPVGGKPPRYLPPSASSAMDGAEAVTAREGNEIATTTGELPFPRIEAPSAFRASALKGGEADGRTAGLVPGGNTEPTL